jgi:L-fucose mutarotase
MLKGLPSIVSPELMSVLMRMGHGDELVLADGNFPAESHAQRLVRADGHGVSALLDAILALLPLDTFVASPVAVMQPVDANAADPVIWAQYRQIIDSREDRAVAWERLERMSFYERARRAYAIVATGETAVYANVILKKGVVFPSSERSACPSSERGTDRGGHDGPKYP